MKYKYRIVFDGGLFYRVQIDHGYGWNQVGSYECFEDALKYLANYIGASPDDPVVMVEGEKP